DGRDTQGLVHIGDVARRLAMRVDTLRAWERRYGLLHPQRSTGGFRLYSSADEAVVRAMIVEIDKGFPPAQAAKLALSRTASVLRGGRTGSTEQNLTGGRTASATQSDLQQVREDLHRELMSFGGAAAQRILDTMLAELTLNTVLRDVVLPCLRRIGEGWGRGEVAVAQEHFASQLLRDRLLGLAREWDQGRGPRALLACPAQERHDIALICFGVVLARSGWRVTFLGPDTPIVALAHAAERLTPDLIVLTAHEESIFAAIAPQLSKLPGRRELALAGPGATPAVVHAAAAVVLEEGPVEAAVSVAAGRGLPTLGERR
ncbi:MAG: B12-binding domain-containing protein, partial [Mycobacteriales bacterium]